MENNCLVCGKECNGKTCSGACRAKLSRSSARYDTTEAHAHGPEAHGIEAHAPKRTVNPLAVPGDADYRGVCVQVDGQWIVRPEPEPTGIKHILKRSDLGTFRGSRPYYLDQDTGLSHLSCEQLHRRLSDLKSWQASPEYAERVYRLTHGLTSHSVPANMVAVL